MSADLLSFGSVFRSKEEYYVYIHGTGEITYAAKILDKDLSDRCVAMYDRSVTQRGGGVAARAEDNVVFAFVVLRTTKDFEGQAANYGKAAENDLIPDLEKVGELSDEDVRSLQEAIVGSKFVAEDVRRVVGEIKL